MTVNRIVTRGMGGGQTVGMILHGFTLETPLRIIRGGRTAARDIYDNLLEDFIIAAKLIQINGKDILAPIFNKRKYTIDESKNNRVIIENFKVNKKESKRTNVFAKIINIQRGSDGKD